MPSQVEKIGLVLSVSVPRVHPWRMPNERLAGTSKIRLLTYTRGSARSALGVGLLCACAVKSSKGDSRDVINLIVGSGFYHVSV